MEGRVGRREEVTAALCWRRSAHLCACGAPVCACLVMPLLLMLRASLPQRLSELRDCLFCVADENAAAMEKEARAAQGGSVPPWPRWLDGR